MAEQWFHGGYPGLGRGEKILPPSVTGALSVADKALGDDELRQAVLKVHRDDVVYLARDPAVARLWASLAPACGGAHRGGDVYEVTPDGPLEPDPDYLAGDGGSACCGSATIIRVAERRVPRPSPAEMAWLSADYSRRWPGVTATDEGLSMDLRRIKRAGWMRGWKP